MGKLVVLILIVGALVDTSLSCFVCFIDIDDSLRLCWGYLVSEYNIRNVDSCFLAIDRIFNQNKQIIEAGQVGRGYDQQLKDILYAEIKPLVEEFDNALNGELIYEEKFIAAAENFIAEASKLPRASGCVPPCGYQELGAVYNCITCQYDGCGYPLDCPISELKVGEHNRTEMQCVVPFPLPNGTEIAWRFAEMVETQQVDQFKTVTVGQDPLYTIPSVRLDHEGTYQCEILHNENSIIRIYYYLTVIPHIQVVHVKLQEIFDMALLPGGQIPPLPVAPHRDQILPSPVLITACMTAIELLLFLSLGFIWWWQTKRRKINQNNTQEPVAPRRKLFLSKLLPVNIAPSQKT